MEITTHSSAETKNLAAKISTSLKGGEVLALYGELGSGKTTFTQGLLAALGIKQRLTSPTFVIYKHYKLKTGSGKFKVLNHVDCYRLEGPKDLTGIDLSEIVSDPTAITVIEWPERIEEILPKEVIKVRFETISENERKITYDLRN